MIGIDPNGQIQKKIILYMDLDDFIVELKKSCSLLSVLGFVKLK